MMNKRKWIIYKWSGHCRHLCVFCKFKRRCKYDRLNIFDNKKPPNY